MNIIESTPDSTIAIGNCVVCNANMTSVDGTIHAYGMRRMPFTFRAIKALLLGARN